MMRNVLFINTANNSMTPMIKLDQLRSNVVK